MTDVTPLKTTFFDAIYETLPSGLKNRVDVLFAEQTKGHRGDDAAGETRHTFDRLLRFSLGGVYPEGDGRSQAEWNEAQSRLELVLSNLKTGDIKDKKREREPGDDHDGQMSQPSKRTKLDFVNVDADDIPVYTLHAFSVAVPVRKKVDITIRQRSICFTNPTGAVEYVVPTDNITRAFLLTTPGKTKAHWTVVMLANTEQNQIAFGTDDVLPSLKTTIHPDPPQTSQKGTSAEASLRKFLSYLPSRIPLLEPSTSHFRSENGEPWLDAYLRAKEGHLFFFQTGILFGLKKPCIWIGMEEIKSIRTMTVTGRTFSIFVTRQPKPGEEEEEGEETEFAMIDGKYQDNVSNWVRNNQHLFGHVGLSDDEEQQTQPEGASRDPMEQKHGQNAADSDESDDSDYHSESDTDGGSPSSASDRDGDGDGENDEEEGEEEQSDGSGSVEDENEDAEGDVEDEDTPLDPSRHPLMAPRAVPRMSKAAMDAVIGMVERDLKGGTSSRHRDTGTLNGHEVDELGYEDEDEDEDDVDQLD